MPNANIKLILDDSRRLTGKSLLWDKPGAILDAFVSGINKQLVVDHWLSSSRRLLDELEWQSEQTCYRIFEDGISLAISAPLDALYAACEINEAAWALTCAELTGQPSEESPAQAITRIRRCIAEETNPALLQLIKQAEQHQAPWLSDDDEFSLGYGASTQVWPVSALPDPHSLDWTQFKTVPIALVTGTNGKSTSVRILSQMIQQSGQCCGVTSTDFIRVGDEIIDYGDYSGPGGARMLLRHRDTETAILEVARGGILRRGLPIDQADAALITNIAADHLGQYGINTVAALAKAKAVIAKSLGANSLVLNADDDHLVGISSELQAKLCWFSLDHNNPLVKNSRAQGGATCFLRDGQLVYADNHEESVVVAVNDIPMTLNGAARHNILNALGAIGVAKSLGLDNKPIADALKQFSSNAADNPGRGNQFDVNNAKVILDFAHNAHSISAMASTVAHIPAKRKFLMISMAGDRSNQEIEQATHSALAMNPDILVAAEVEAYLRGRSLGETTQLIEDIAIAKGMSKDQIFITESPYEGTQLIVEQLQASDLALLLVLTDRDKITHYLASL